MANSKISDLVALVTPSSSDLFPIVDVSDTSQGSSGSTRKITYANLIAEILTSPTLTGTTVLPSTTSIGNVSATEIGYVDGVTSSIQTQLDAKPSTASPTFTGIPAAPTAAVGTNTTQIATTAFVYSNITIETGTSTTQSLTTTTNQRVIVFAKGTTGNATGTVSLLYNAVSKDTVTFDIAASAGGPNGFAPFSLMYTETPGAATQNITITGSNGNVKIIVIKIG